MIFSVVFGCIKLPAFLSLLTLFILSGLAGKFLLPPSALRLRFFSWNTHLWSKLACRVLRIKIKQPNFASTQIPQNCLMVSNHLSYLDILIISALHPTLFITSVEIQKTLFLGLLAQLGGSYFVERRSPCALQHEISEIKSLLKRGFSVTLFPEGTTSNGDSVLPFKNSLIASAVNNGTAILPLCLKYEKIMTTPVSSQNRDLVYWYGKSQFFPHLFKFLFFCPKLEVHAYPLELIFPDPALPLSLQRKTVAARARQVILSQFHA